MKTLSSDKMASITGGFRPTEFLIGVSQGAIVAAIFYIWVRIRRKDTTT
jgi:bacteriocin-like protein